jgi:hypothetical protein
MEAISCPLLSPSVHASRPAREQPALESDMTGRPIHRWVPVVIAFALASGCQVLLYTPFGRGQRSILSPLGSPARELLFMLGPVLLASAAAIKLLRGTYQPERHIPGYAIALVVLLAAVSVYIGVVVSFNTWGT